MNLAALSGATARMDPRQVETQNTLAVRRFSLSQEAKADKERGEVATPTHRFVESKPKGKAPGGMLQVLYQICLFIYDFPKLD